MTRMQCNNMIRKEWHPAYRKLRYTVFVRQYYELLSPCLLPTIHKRNLQFDLYEVKSCLWPITQKMTLSTKYSGKISKLLMTKCIICNSVLFPPFFLSFPFLSSPFLPSFSVSYLPASSTWSPRKLVLSTMPVSPPFPDVCTSTLYFLPSVQWLIFSNLWIGFTAHLIQFSKYNQTRRFSAMYV